MYSVHDDFRGQGLSIHYCQTGRATRNLSAVDLGELVTQAAVRETLEEAGIESAITGIRNRALPGTAAAALVWPQDRA
jgi:hypothetical protein